MTRTADVFDTLHRFHIYDHEQDAWLMSGVDFGAKGTIIDHAYDDGLDAFDDPATLVADKPHLSLVWEDGEHAEYKSDPIDAEVANEICTTAAAAVATGAEFSRENVRVARIIAPDEVEYVLIGE